MTHLLKTLTATALLIIAAAGIARAEPPPAYEGQRLYVSYCQLCHGTEGKGDGPLAKSMGLTPADLTTTVRARSDAILTRIITGEGQTITGRDRHNLISDAMPEWKDIFDDDEVTALIAWLRFMSRAKHDLVGDPAEGFELFQKYCRVCHGDDGYGDGVMGKLLAMSPMDLTNPIETDTLDNDQMARTILDGSGRYMPAWRGILSQEDVEALVSYIRLLAF
ncbi:c-type cytochrome [Alisedimentitalea sp. MJ-SS2]|uniref:c-type cytochrome n=1 Tax=Aliisedimentitalea sp. MJ-SS2 TaxID=3049795 RepID=UPI002912A5D5|nr:c-type cytochrome [Alisedimentitalea sp. MJ-SS2]MDU8928166.1 c-type cytochrome [Alisedimentitalea sp. MJ-SS2]